MMMVMMKMMMMRFGFSMATLSKFTYFHPRAKQKFKFVLQFILFMANIAVFSLESTA
jgi:hypothetical protein